MVERSVNSPMRTALYQNHLRVTYCFLLINILTQKLFLFYTVCFCLNVKLVPLNYILPFTYSAKINFHCNLFANLFIYWVFSRTDTFRVIWFLPAYTRVKLLVQHPGCLVKSGSTIVSLHCATLPSQCC